MLGLGHLFPETHRFCLEDECPSLSHLLQVGGEQRVGKVGHFIPSSFSISASLSLSSLGLFLSLCPSLFLPLLGDISTPSHQAQPCPHATRDLAVEASGLGCGPGTQRTGQGAGCPLTVSTGPRATLGAWLLPPTAWSGPAPVSKALSSPVP